MTTVYRAENSQLGLLFFKEKENKINCLFLRCKPCQNEVKRIFTCCDERAEKSNFQAKKTNYITLFNYLCQYGMPTGEVNGCVGNHQSTELDAYDGLLAVRQKAMSDIWDAEDYSSALPIANVSSASGRAPALAGLSGIGACKTRGKKVVVAVVPSDGDASIPGYKQLHNALKGCKDVILASSRARRHLMKPMNILRDKLQLASDTCNAALKEISQDYLSED